MKLKNILIVVEDIERSKQFYHELFGLDVVTDFGGNVILTEGLVLQEKAVWERLIGQASVCGNADAELYFEENNLDVFLHKLETCTEPIRYLHPPMEHEWRQRVVRLYDPDGHVIEVGESMEYVARKSAMQEMSRLDGNEKTGNDD